MKNAPPLTVLLIAATLAMQSREAAGQEPGEAYHPARDLKLEQIEWLEDDAVFLDKKRFKTSLTRSEQGFDRAGLLSRALDRAREQGRPVLWYVYKVSENTKRGRQMIRAPILDLAMRQIIWSDPAVERVVKASFVPLRMVCDEALAKRFKLRPLEFLEPSVIFLAPDGKVLHVLRTIRTFSATWFAGVMRAVLQVAHGPLAGLDVGTALDRGEWKQALMLLQRVPNRSVSLLYRQAVLKRRLQDGEGALALLEEAAAAWEKQVTDLAKSVPERRRSRFLRALKRGQVRGSGDENARRVAEDLMNLRAERGLVLARMGQNEHALAPLRQAADSRVGERGAEAAYVLALLRLHAGDEAGANRRFQKILQDHPDTIHGRRARANVLLGVDDGRPIGAAFAGLERVTWLPGGAFTQLPGDTRWPGKPLSVDDLVRHGTRLLLQQQRDNGGWNDSRYAYCPDARITPNVWVAISALCCQALARNRSRAGTGLASRIDDALRRGEAYLLDSRNLNRGRNEDVYSDAYRLLFLARRHASLGDGPERRDLRRGMLSIVRDAASRQGSDGFWAHEYRNAFCTAPMVQGLLAARKAGIPVPEDMLLRAKEAMLSARYSDGSFSYGGTARGRPRAGNLRNSSTRMPLCEGALHALGGSDLERLNLAFDTFWKFYDRIEGVRRTDYHSDGQIAGFMFFHALYHTSESITQLPPERRAAHHERLLRKVRSYPEIDGTFMDSHELGRSYGTAMALLVIANALEVQK